MAPSIPLFSHISSSSCHCLLLQMQLWAKQSFGHPSGEHDAKPKIMSSAKRPGVLICAWHRVEKVRQPQAGRAQAALASICLQMTMRTSLSVLLMAPAWVCGCSQRKRATLRNSSVRKEKQNPLVLEQAGGRSLPSWGFRPCHSCGAVCGEVMGYHGKLQ